MLIRSQGNCVNRELKNSHDKNPVALFELITSHSQARPALVLERNERRGEIKDSPARRKQRTKKKGGGKAGGKEEKKEGKGGKKGGRLIANFISGSTVGALD